MGQWNVLVTRTAGFYSHTVCKLICAPNGQKPTDSINNLKHTVSRRVQAPTSPRSAEWVMTSPRLIAITKTVRPLHHTLPRRATGCCCSVETVWRLEELIDRSLFRLEMTTVSRLRAWLRANPPQKKTHLLPRYDVSCIVLPFQSLTRP